MPPPPLSLSRPPSLRYTKRQYILYPCGDSVPDVSSVTLPSGYKRRYFKVPLQLVAAADTTVNPYLQVSQPASHSHVRLPTRPGRLRGAAKLTCFRPSVPQALKQQGSELGVADRLVAVSQYSVDACMQKAKACTTNKAASALASTTPGWSGTTAVRRPSIPPSSQRLSPEWTARGPGLTDGRLSLSWCLQDFHKILNVTGAYFDYSDSGSVYYNPSNVVTFSASAVSGSPPPPPPARPAALPRPLTELTRARPSVCCLFTPHSGQDAAGPC